LAASTTLYVSIALFWVGGWGLGRDLDYEQELGFAEARALAMEKEAQRAHLLAVRRHLDPHFLFNTLNAIAEWCRQDGEVAERAVLKLSELLRTVLDGVPLAVWPLSKELELVRNLFELHLIRDPEMFSLEMNIEPGAANRHVPPLILLPLAENAVTHGPAKGHRGTISLRVHEQGARLVVSLENPGPYTGRRDGGSGLDTVQSRLALAYDGKAEFNIEAQGDRTETTVSSPLRIPPSVET
jgi:LytS/YehU family sensor histidine kinase